MERNIGGLMSDQEKLAITDHRNIEMYNYYAGRGQYIAKRAANKKSELLNKSRYQPYDNNRDPYANVARPRIPQIPDLSALPKLPEIELPEIDTENLNPIPFIPSPDNSMFNDDLNPFPAFSDDTPPNFGRRKRRNHNHN